jgi:hypothetical protein
VAGSLFSRRFGEAAGLEEEEGDHGHQGVAMEALPGSPFEVIEAELLFQPSSSFIC